MSKMSSSVGKTLLKNIIRHTDTHNRILEETDMWRQQRVRRNHHGDYRHPWRRRSSSPRAPRAHMDRLEDTEPRRYPDEEPGTASTYWMRQLYDAEQKDPDRWGHGGYKELYPDEFHSDRSLSETEKGSTQKHKKRKKRKHEKEKEHKTGRREKTHDEERKSTRKKHKRTRSSDHVHKHRSRKRREKSKKHKEARDISTSPAKRGDDNILSRNSAHIRPHYAESGGDVGSVSPQCSTSHGAPVSSVKKSRNYRSNHLDASSETRGNDDDKRRKKRQRTASSRSSSDGDHRKHSSQGKKRSWDNGDDRTATNLTTKRKKISSDSDFCSDSE